MSTYRDLLARVRAEIDEIAAAEALERLSGDEPVLFLDVRDPEEWAEGHIPGAVHLPRTYFESRVEGVAPDKRGEIVVYCAGGSRSAFVTKTMLELGYEHVVNLAGGFTDWKRAGYETT
ncbi:MAG: rhodanese-like domain-containing protein, partial [Thermoleophilia bacterium]|nr:rhodanese-like domain-containing protein [Thermoleophilia bacterium]